VGAGVFGAPGAAAGRPLQPIHRLPRVGGRREAVDRAAAPLRDASRPRP
jgi:hypothetical protein